MRATTLASLLALLATACYGKPPCDGCEDTGTDTDASGYADTDGDTIRDADEGASSGRDTDGDTVPDYLDDDSDGDGWSDALEAGDDDTMTRPADSDSDGTPDFIDLDSDDNGVDDAAETDGDLDGDGVPDRADIDDDGDGCIDVREGSATLTDTDDSGGPDFRDTDSDGDGIGDDVEGCVEDCDHDGLPNRVDTDSDGNGVGDDVEGDVNTDADCPTGADEVGDFCDMDNDGDGIKDVDEAALYGTDPDAWDTDGDGDFDYLEIVAGHDPLEASDALPEDVLVVGPTSDPVDVTVTTTIPRLDLCLVAGTGGDVSAETASLAADLPSLVDAIPVDDVEVAVASFEDFGTLGYGPSGAVPVSVLLQATGDGDAIASALADLEARAALMEGTIASRTSGVEAIHQILTGEGLGPGLIPPASCTTSPFEPERFGLACLRRDAYTVIAVLADRLVWNGPGCLEGDPACWYDEDDFPALGAPHGYAETGGVAHATGVRMLGVVSDPASPLGEEPRAWLGSFALATTTVDGAGGAVLVDVGPDAASTASATASAVADLVTRSPFDAVAAIVDLPDAPPQAEVSVHAYTLTALPVACSPASGEWGSCSFASSRIEGVGPGVEVTVRLVFVVPSAHRNVDVLAFEVRFEVEERMVTDVRHGYLVVPERWDPEI